MAQPPRPRNFVQTGGCQRRWPGSTKVEPFLVELSGTALSRMIPPIPVPADGTQTKCPDFATRQDKEKLVPSQGNLPSTPPRTLGAQAGSRSGHSDPPTPKMGFRTLFWPWRGSRASGGNLRSSRTPGSRERKEVGRSLAGKRERGHFRSREVTAGRGTSRRKGPGEGRAGKRQRGAGKIALLLRSLALRRQWGHQWTISGLGFYGTDCFSELPLANRLERQDRERRD